jgi:hypothetical protein
MVYSLYSVSHDGYLIKNNHRIGFGGFHDAITMDATEIQLLCARLAGYRISCPSDSVNSVYCVFYGSDFNKILIIKDGNFLKGVDYLSDSVNRVDLELGVALSGISF